MRGKQSPKKTCRALWTTAALVAAATALAAPAYAQGRRVIWPQFHGRPSHEGTNPLENKVGPDNAQQLSPKWWGFGDFSKLAIVFRSSPAVTRDRVYFGDTAGVLYAFDAEGCGDQICDPVWKAPLTQGIYSSPAVAGGVVVVGTSSVEGALFAFPAAGCGGPVCSTPLWQSTPLSVLDSSPTIADGVVYVGSDDGVYAFALQGCGAAVCPPLWVGHTAGQVDNSPAVAGGVVYAGASDGKLYAFPAGGCGASTCRPLWTGQTGAAIYASSPAVANGVVYVGSYWDGKLNAFAAAGCGAATCPALWTGDAGTYVNSSPAVADGRVYVGSGEAEMKVFDAAGCGQSVCSPVWVGFIPGPQATMEGPPMVSNGVVYVGENNNRVAAFDAAGCGQYVCDPLWQYITQDPIVNSSPVMVNGTLYVTGTNFGALPVLYVFGLPGSE